MQEASSQSQRAYRLCHHWHGLCSPYSRGVFSSAKRFTFHSYYNPKATPSELLALLLFAVPSELTLQKFVALLA